MTTDIAKSIATSRISGTRAYGLQEKWISRIADIYSMANSCYLTSEAIRNEVSRLVLETPEFTRVSYTTRRYIQGYWRARCDELYRTRIRWALSCDGRLLTSKEVDDLTFNEIELGLDKTTPDYRSPWSRINNDLSRHVWTDRQGNVLKDKPFQAKFVLI